MFALDVIQLVEKLPRTTSGRTIGNQLVRSGTSVAANYRACCRARTRAEFIAKLGIVIEEADESGFWLEMIQDAKLLRPVAVERLRKEADELVRIMTQSRKTARTNRKK